MVQTNKREKKYQPSSETYISENRYLYEGRIVDLITVFNEGSNSIAIVEDEKGKQFEVFKNKLVKIEDTAVSS